MEINQETLNISSLPEAARAELIDFYEFLSQKYTASATGSGESLKKTHGLDRFLREPLRVKKLQSFSRDALHERR